MPSRFVTTARTTLALGLHNVARVASYRLRLRAGIHPAQWLPRSPAPQGRFFAPVAGRATPTLPNAWISTAEYFGWYRELLDGPPDWHRNPFTNTRSPVGDTPWWTLGDFDASVGDIKTVWEASRFEWAMSLAQHAAAGDGSALDRLNDWLNDWSEKNPPYVGANWKCGQEASIRVMRLAVAALVLGQAERPEPQLLSLLTIHLKRIAPTLAYAVGQDNNHGTSEAAALFIGGAWLEKAGIDGGAAWHRAGRKWLAERAMRLIGEDGSFSQYSVNYHRLMLDTLALAEIWRRHLALEPLSKDFSTRALAAAEWLRAMTDPLTGGAPNTGANDGANLLRLTNADYADFRPSVHLAAAVFQDRVAFPENELSREELAWLGVDPPARPVDALRSQLYDDGGYAVLRRPRVMALLRYPRFRFRPSHADALHVDLWVAGENLLRDGGTYSYAADSETQSHFVGARGHNTLQLGDHEQMQRLSRFLWGGWLRTLRLDPITETRDDVSVAASYRDAFGATHERRVTLGDSFLRVQDTFTATGGRATLRWRLRPGAWSLTGNVISDGEHRLLFSANVPVVRVDLTSGWESRYYLKRTALPVVELELASDGTVSTEYTWSR